MYYLKGHPFGAIRQNWLLTVNIIMEYFFVSNAHYFVLAYIFTYLLCILFWNICQKNKSFGNFIKVILFFFLSIPFSLLCAFRNEDTGWDTHTVINGYLYKSGEMSEFAFNYLFSYYRSFIYWLSNANVQFYLLSLAIITLSFVFYSILKVSKNSSIFAYGCLMFMLYLSPLMLNQSRQFIAVGIIMLAFVNLVNDKIALFVSLILVASLIHESSLIMLPLFFSRYLHKLGMLGNIIILLCIALSFSSLSVFVGIVNFFTPEKFSYVQEDQHSSTSGYAWIIDVLPMLYVVFAYFRNKKSLPFRSDILMLCSLTALPLRLSGYYSYFFMRLSYYGEAVSVILLVWVLAFLPKKKRIYYYAGSFVFFLLHWYLDFVIIGIGNVIPYISS